jgi:hypothetical protein
MPKFLLAVFVLLPGQIVHPRAAGGVPFWQTDVVDEIARDLRRFRAEKDERGRIALIERLGPIRDPRILVAMMDEVVSNENAHRGELMLASWMVVRHQIPRDAKLAVGAKYWTVARIWWEENGDSVRRRAQMLPQ